MDTTKILRRLSLREPLFVTFPTVRKKRICGTETECGNSDKDGNPTINITLLPIILPNGGEVYVDCGNHIEYASPECSNPVTMTAYYDAGKIIVRNLNCAEKIHHLTTDYKTTFGAHENHFTCAPRGEWPRLIPFLIARSIICGAGWINPAGEFEITQRARYITCAASLNTTSNRGILNLRDEPLASVKGFDRLHLICADANMSQVSTYLRMAITALVIEMLEMGALPEVSYDFNMAASDIKTISKQTHNWRLQGIQSGCSKDGLALLRLYLNRAKELFSRRDEVTDTTLVIWEDTLDKLEENPMLLWRRLDWVTKLMILGEFENNEGSNQDRLRDQDMEYHNINPDEGLFYFLQQSGEMERIVSDKLVVQATLEPPADTRAYARGKISQFLAEEGGHRSLCGNGWSHLSVVNAENLEMWGRQPEECSYLSERIDNPFEPYKELVERFKRRLRAL